MGLDAKRKSMAVEISLTARGSLKWGARGEDWAPRLFALGADKTPQANEVRRFWRKFAAACVNALCHAANPGTPDADEGTAIRRTAFPEDTDWLEIAPPMQGGEYLNGENLRRLWANLLEWCAGEIEALGGMGPFLARHAPGWEKVGRVFFHLGENRLNETRPFVFLATYVTGLNEKGQPRHAPLAQALKRYAGSGNQDALTRLLEPMQKALKSLPWVERLCESGSIYKAEPMTAAEAYSFLLSIEKLESLGIGVSVPDWWKKRPRPRVSGEFSLRQNSLMGMNSLLNFDCAVALGEENVSDEELEKLLSISSPGLILLKNQWVEIDSEKLREALDHWRKIKSSAQSGQITFAEGMRLLAGFRGQESDDPEDIDESWGSIRAGEDIKKILQSTMNLRDPVKKVPGLKGELRPYQKTGVSWLRFMGRLGLGACLADDMGLGKTIQVLGLLLLESRAEDAPALLVAPASLLANWKNESRRFAPDLRILVLHPSELSAAAIRDFADPEKLREYDLVMTTYSMLPRLKWLRDIEWSRIIADEAQNIKNWRARRSVAIRKLRAPIRLALTGTPMENSLFDLWSLFDFLNPGLLGSAREFGALLKKLEKSPAGRAPLRRISSPFIMRRLKTDKNVIDSLPDKTETPLYCPLSAEQASLYQQVVDRMREGLLNLDKSPENAKKRNMLVISNIMLLKQICNHPAQAGIPGDGYAPERSGKFREVGELCAELASRQERVLIFTQFREIIGPLSSYLQKIFGAPGLALHGGTPVKERERLVREFQREDGAPFFILSLKAGGVGLNLTAASHVIHFDRWWNPAVEDQATDRAYRIGQRKNVFVHKCLVPGTLEEKINDLSEEKKKMAEQILGGLDNNITAMSDEEIMKLVSLDAGHIVEE